MRFWFRAFFVWWSILLSASWSFATTAGNGIIVQDGSITFDPTDFGTVTWGSGATFTWTFNTTAATDPEITFSTGSIILEPGTSPLVQIAPMVTGQVGLEFNDLDTAGASADGQVVVNCVDTTTDDCSFRVDVRLGDLDDARVIDAVAKVEGDNDIFIGSDATGGTDTISLVVNGEVVGDAALVVPSNSITSSEVAETSFNTTTWGDASTDIVWTFSNLTGAGTSRISFNDPALGMTFANSNSNFVFGDTGVSGNVRVEFDEGDTAISDNGVIVVDCPDTTTPVNCSMRFEVSNETSGLDDTTTWAEVVGVAGGLATINIGETTDTQTINLQTNSTGDGELDVPDNSINLTTGAGQEVTGVLPSPNGGTGANLTVTDDDVLVGTAGGVFALDDVPDCDAATDALTYDITANNFDCHAIPSATLAFGTVNATSDGAGNGSAIADASPDAVEFVGSGIAGLQGIDIICEDVGPESCTWSFDATEIGTETWGAGGSFTWTFDVVSNDPFIIFDSNTLIFGAPAGDPQLQFDHPTGTGLDNVEIMATCADATDCGFEIYTDVNGVLTKFFDLTEGVAGTQQPTWGDTAATIEHNFRGLDPVEQKIFTSISTTANVASQWLTTCATIDNCTIRLEHRVGAVANVDLLNASTAAGVVTTTIGAASTGSITLVTDSTGNTEVVVPAESIGAAEIDSGPTENDILITKSGVMAYRSFDATDFSVGASTIVLGANVTELGAQIGDTSAEFSNPIQFGTLTLDGDSSINIFTNLIGSEASGGDINIDGTSHVTAGSIQFHTGTRTVAAASHNMLTTGTGTTTFNGTTPTVRVLFVTGTWQFDVAPPAGAGASVFNFAPTITSGATGLDMPDINTFISNTTYLCNHAACNGIVLNNAVQNSTLDADTGETIAITRVVEGVQQARLGDGAGDTGTYNITDWTGWWIKAPILSAGAVAGTVNFTRITGVEIDDYRTASVDAFGDTTSVWSKGADIKMIHRGDIVVGSASSAAVPAGNLTILSDSETFPTNSTESAADAGTRNPHFERYQIHQQVVNTTTNVVIRTFDAGESAIIYLYCTGVCTAGAGCTASTDTAQYETRAFMDYDGTNPIFTAGPTVVATNEDAALGAATDCTLNKDDTGDTLRLSVVSAAANETLDFSATIDIWFMDGT